MTTLDPILRTWTLHLSTDSPIPTYLPDGQTDLDLILSLSAGTYHDLGHPEQLFLSVSAEQADLD